MFGKLKKKITIFVKNKRMKLKPKYYVSKKTGTKYPYGNTDNPCKFPIGTVLYINSSGNSSLKPLPLDEYPYTIEYSNEEK